MNKIHSQVIALTKNIHLIKPISETGFIAQFFAGKTEPYGIGGGIGINWWYTRKTFKLLEDIAFMIIRDYREFSGCDHDSVKGSIQKTFTEICVDERVFNGDKVVFGHKGTLFSCKNDIDTNQYASIIVDELFKNIRSSITSWCLAYVAPRVSGETFAIDSEKIYAINKMDEENWGTLVTSDYQTNGWNPVTGCTLDGTMHAFSKIKFDYIFVSKESGTLEGSKFSSSLKLKKFMAVIFSINSEKRQHSLNKVVADPNKACLQFPHKTSYDLGICISAIGDLLPYYSQDLLLSADDIIKVKGWYEAEIKLEYDARNRIGKCAHFINHAMKSSDIESYINYFISLDALFGKRGSVEKSIVDGVSKLPEGLMWSEKISWLFELRSELVHGSCRYIKEWSKHFRYSRHFSSEPSDDIEKLAFIALYHSPHLLCQPNQLSESKPSFRVNLLCRLIRYLTGNK